MKFQSSVFQLFYRCFVLLVIVLVISGVSSKSFSENYSFKHININDGLSQNAVFAILKDSKGYMWFGTKDGLNKYDGYNFVSYHNDPFDSTTISASYVLSLYEDSRGLIWVGTFDGGLNVFERSSEVFHRMELSDSKKNQGEFFEIRAITEDANGRIWVATHGEGLFRLELQEDGLLNYSVKRFTHNNKDPESINSDIILSLAIDKNKDLWIGTIKGLNRYQPDDESFVHYTVDTKNPRAMELPERYSISSVLESESGQLWLGTVGGLVNFNRQDGSYEYYPHKFDLYRYGWGNIRQFVEDSDGNLWLATATELMKFDMESKSYQSFVHDPYDSKTISYNSIASLFYDDTEILWVGTVGKGIDYYNKRAAPFSVLKIKPERNSRMNGFSVGAVLEDRAGNIWISAGVLYKWERKTGNITSFEKSSNEPSAFGNTEIFALVETANGQIWTGSTEGLFSYHPETKEVKRFIYDPNKPNGLPQRNVYDVFADSEGKIWVATDKYLSKLTDEEKGIFQNIVYRDGPDFVENNRPVIFQDKNEQIWLGTKFGLLKLNPDFETFTVYKNEPQKLTTLSNNHIKSICADPLYPERYLWIGTTGGLNRLDTEEGTIVNYTVDDGLPNNVIYGILPDGKNHLWLSTNKGLSMFSQHTGQFRNYTVNDGLQSNEFNTGAYFKSKNGELFFGGIEGLSYFNPDLIKNNENLPNVVLTKIKLGNSSISQKTHPEILDKAVELTEKIELSHKDDIVTFEFAALDFSSPEKNEYAYMLENLSEKWINATGTRSATFTHLPPGKYVFRVKASNNDGFWNEEGLAVQLQVNPPWTNTWYAYLLFGLGVFGIVMILRRYEINRIGLKNQLKYEKISADSLREIDKVKSNFFANISHEFRTPLTLILGQLESVMSTDLQYNNKMKLLVANRNARRLLTLINQLLDLSKLEAGNMKLEANKYNIISFLKSVLYSFESMAANKKITLKFETEKEKIPVVFDIDKMEKVFYNLISNAIKYTNETGSVLVSVKNVESLFVEIKVKDTGTGIPDRYIPHIFDRFYQVDESSTRNFEGTGIGLALVKELVEMHKGTVKVKSKEGEGTEFTVKLPVLKEEMKEKTTEVPKVKSDITTEYYQENVSKAKAEMSALEKMLSKSKKEIVLIVEDNKDVRSYIHEQLSDTYEIVEAENGEKGVELATEILPDLIVTDLMMPKLNGYQFCKIVRAEEKTSHIPIIMLTAKADPEDKIEGLEIGVDDYITKPFSAKELKVRINNLIVQRKLLRERFKNATVIRPSEVSVISTDQVFLEKIIKNIEANFENQGYTPESLANDVNMSVSQLNRKLNALVNQPAGQLMRSLRLQRAADLLKQKAGTIAEICYQLDFNDPAYFSRAFKKQFGCSPTEYINN